MIRNQNSEDDVLQFLSMEEGRIRPVRDANSNITVKHF